MTNRKLLMMALMGLMASPVIAMKRAGSQNDSEKPSKRIRQGEVHPQAIFEPIYSANFDEFMVMAKQETNPNKKNLYTGDPLLLSFWKGDFTLEQKKKGYALLQAKGADINAKDFHKGATLLHFAVSGDDKSFVSQLVQDKADIHAIDKDGDTPIFYACIPEMIQECLNHGANINHRNNQGQTVLFDLASRGEEDKVKTLVIFGIDCEIKDHKGRTGYESAIQVFGDSHPFIQNNDIARNKIIMPALERSVGNTVAFVHNRGITGRTMNHQQLLTHNI